jgi:putative endopeptidase
MNACFFGFLWLILFLGQGPLAFGSADFLSANIDVRVSPRDNFFQYANGTWFLKNPIPESESGWGVGELVQDEVYQRMLQVNEGAEKSKNEVGSTSQKIGDFWTSAMNTTEINRMGISPLKNQLAEIASIKSEADLGALAAKLKTDGVSCFFDSAASQDDKSSEEMVYVFYQGGLGLPNREYYFENNPETLQVRKAYLAYLEKTFLQLGQTKTEATQAANAVYDLEKKLAAGSKKLADLRDPIANYHPMTFDKLAKTAPNFNWKIFAKTVGIENIDKAVIVGQPQFFKVLSHELKQTPLRVWQDYLRFHLVSSFAGSLDDTTFQNYFNFQKALSGAETPRPRWKRMIDEEEHMMGELVGQLFAKQYFNENTKKRYRVLVEAIRTAYAERIRQIPWMSEQTKAKALDKLAKLNKKVGYPDRWKDFSDLKITPHSFFENTLAANHFWHFYNIHKLGKPVDHFEWDMTPQTYNAFYNASSNEIVLPAAVFTVPGMKDEDLDDAFVYGYAGASTIGHEITHGFDDHGRQYDAHGNLADWWTPEDAKKFKVRAQSIVDQFNEFIPIDKLHVNGLATEGENIADLGGLRLGLDAFKKTKQYQANEKIAGLTPVQRYFLGYAYGWLYHEHEEKLASQLMTDVHAPAKERVNGPMMNIPEFYAAFGIKKGDPMYRDENKRVSIW